MALPDSPGGTTRAEQIAFYASYLAKLPGTYNGAQTGYDGLTWAGLYEAIASQNTSADPRQLAGAVVILEGAQRLGTGTAAAEAGLGKFLTTSEKAVADTQFAPSPIASPLAGLASIGDFFSRLTQASTWLRVLEAILGAGLILVGLAKLAGNTPAGRAAARVAAKAALL